MRYLIEQRFRSARMIGEKLAHVINIAIDRNPAALGALVLRELLYGDGAAHSGGCQKTLTLALLCKLVICLGTARAIIGSSNRPKKTSSSFGPPLSASKNSTVNVRVRGDITSLNMRRIDCGASRIEKASCKLRPVRMEGQLC